MTLEPSTDSDAAITGSRLIAERAYLALRDRIVTLELPPGSPLREDALMRDLGIGRTPLREAVKRLALEDLVAVQPRRGTFVTEVDAADIVHITEVRAALEGFAAALAAERMDEPRSRRAQALLDETARLPDDGGHDALMRFDQRIHRFTWETAGNPYLSATLERYFALSLRVWYLVLASVPALGPAVHDQERLLEALLARDAERARTLMHDHVAAFHAEIATAFAGARPGDGSAPVPAADVPAPPTGPRTPTPLAGALAVGGLHRR